MAELWSGAYQETLKSSPWELLAVVLALAYLLLIMRENSLGWFCAFISTAIYTVLFWQVSLPMQAGLNIYYMAMAAYGWHHWRRGGPRATNSEALIHSWSWRQHMFAVLPVLLLTVVSGLYLNSRSEASLLYLDSLVTWGSVVTTWMVARKVLENWLYWVLIDSAAIVLYVDRNLYLTTLLFVAYVLIAIFGYFGWCKRMTAQTGRNPDQGQGEGEQRGDVRSEQSGL